MPVFCKQTVKKMMLRLFFALAAASFLTGCVSLPCPEGFSYREIKTDDFSLASFARVAKKGAPLRVYIEGDGFAWINPRTPSADPTPVETTVLDLARRDTYPNLVYLARPCQYVSSRECKVYYWTGGRFDPKVVRSEKQAISKLMTLYQAKTAELVGYSGGAAVALLAAKDMPEITRVVTVAGVLDHAAWTKHHGDTPLKGSMNPADYKEKLAKVKQVHYSGGLDKNVPSALTEKFVYALGKDSRADIIIVPNASHNKGWVENWRRLID